MINDRLRRVTDLFVEGTELFFGFESDETTPILMWVNKLNSFEMEEAVRDGATRRAIRLAQLTEDSSEIQAIRAEMASWSDDKLAEQRVEQQVDEIYLKVLNDIDADPEWRERSETARRGRVLLDDSNTPEDSPEREVITKAQISYLGEIRERQAAEQMDRLADTKMNARSDNEAAFIEEWKKRSCVDAFMTERGVTEIFSALRDCKGTTWGEDKTSELEFDHTSCDHSKRLLADRSEVYSLPEPVLGRIRDALDGVTVPARDAGNLDAPASSSASSERSDEEAAASTPSIPEETPLAAPTT